MNWREILLFMPVCALVYLLIYLRIRRWKGFRPCWGTLVLIWFLAVAWSTLLRRAPGDFGGFQPLFASYRYALVQPEAYRSNFMNILLFFPGGLLLTPLMKGRRIWMALAGLILYSMVIEILQYRFSLGTGEMDDILHNSLGALFGAGTAALAGWITEKQEIPGGERN